jgi:hypothetical protein
MKITTSQQIDVVSLDQTRNVVHRNRTCSILKKGEVKMTKILSVLTFAMVFPVVLSAQAVTTFVKAPEGYCWEDTKEYVKQNGRGINADDTQHLLTGQFAEVRSGAGDLTLNVRTLIGKNKKGEEGCTILVEEIGGAAASSLNQKANAAYGSFNTRFAANIAAVARAQEKAREKKEKQEKKP